jgi:PAS domain S-box-containing protein
MKTRNVLFLSFSVIVVLSALLTASFFLTQFSLNSHAPQQKLIGYAVLTGLGLLVLSFTSAHYLSFLYTKPLLQLGEIAEQSLNGTYHSAAQINGFKEVKELSQIILNMSTSMRDTMEKLKESEELYRMLFNLESDAIFLISNEDGSILAANEAACQLYGYSLDELLTMKNTDLSHEPEQTKRVTTTMPILQENVVFIPLRYHRKKDGTVITVEITGRFFNLHGMPVHIAALRDITERQQVQLLIQNQNDELRAQNEELLAQAQALRELESDLTLANLNLEKRVSERTKQLEMAVQELEAFAYSVSHDLRAPLRAIDGFCQMLQEDYLDQLDQRGQHYICRIRNGAQQMWQLIEDLLHLSHISRLKPHLQIVNLSELVRNICQEISSLSPQRKAVFDIEENIYTNVDLGLIRIALENLIRNAWKFSSNNEVTVIRFGMQQHSDKIVYFLADNGVGFNMEYADKLFLPFQRLHKPTGV